MRIGREEGEEEEKEACRQRAAAVPLCDRRSLAKESGRLCTGRD